jgi:putative endonuclease
MSRSHVLGRLAETMAALHLEHCGYEILARRFRRPGAELDLVIGRRGLVAFVEVKGRSSSAGGLAEEGLHPRQLQRLRRAARLYLAEHPGHRRARLRFDLVAVDFRGDGRGCRLRHFAGII